MHEHGNGEERLEVGSKNLILVGQPNVGKSVIFSRISGRYVTVANYPGTTVGVSQGRSRWLDGCNVVDTPGMGSLVPRTEDERVARSILLDGADKVVLQVGDAKNLKRTLMLTTQLQELGLPLVVDLNMSDEAQRRGYRCDSRRLGELLDTAVVETVAVSGEGLDELERRVREPRRSAFTVRYEAAIEEAVAQIEQLLPELSVSARGAALLIIAGDADFRDWLSDRMPAGDLAQIDGIVSELRKRHTEPLGYVISRQRAAAVERILTEVLRGPRTRGPLLAERLGRWSTHPVGGMLFFAAVLYAVYQVVGRFGAGTVVDFVESVVFGEYINVWATSVVGLVPLPILQEFLVGEYGLITMGLTYAIAIVLPIMTFFFLAFGILEDSGYLPRLAVMANKLFRIIGLSGRAVLPMVLGLGCDTMATLTTRTLETRRERVVATLLLALAIPCSAQLGVILAMLGAVSGTAFVLFSGIITAVLLVVGRMASEVVPGEAGDFIVEVPPLRVPKLSNVVLKTVFRVEWFLKEAVPLFLLGTAMLFVADKVGALALAERAASPIVQGWLGLPPKATQAFILGFLRRDYGAAGLFQLQNAAMLSGVQAMVSLVTITLFVPCIANLLVIVKERGLRTAVAIVVFIFPFAVLVGGLVNLALRGLEVRL